jgi:hypothetical protein
LLAEDAVVEPLADQTAQLGAGRLERAPPAARVAAFVPRNVRVRRPSIPAPREMSDPCNVGSGARFAVRRVSPVLRARSPQSHRGNTALLVNGISPPGGRRVLLLHNGLRPSSHSGLMPINGKSRLLAANEFPS